MSKQFREYLSNHLHKQSGQGMTEYIVIVALIAVAAIATYTFFGETVRQQTAGLAKEIAGQSASAQISAAGTASSSAATEASKKKDLSAYNNK